MISTPHRQTAIGLIDEAVIAGARRAKACAEERAAVLDICNSETFASLPPSQIVPNLADQGQYLASESSF